MQTLRAPIWKNISKLLVLKVVIYCILQNYSGSGLAFQIRLLFLLKNKIPLFYLLSFAFIRFVTRCHSLSFTVTCCTTPLVVIPCHSLYHSLSFVVSLDALYCRCHSLSLVVIRCTTCCHSLSLVVIWCHSMYHSSVFL